MATPESSLTRHYTGRCSRITNGQFRLARTSWAWVLKCWCFRIQPVLSCPSCLSGEKREAYMRNPGRKTGKRKSSKRPRQGPEGRRSSEVRGLPQRSQAAEHAVNTWYAAHIVMYVTFKHGSQDHYPVWENIVLVEAPTEEEA